MTEQEEEDEDATRGDDGAPNARIVVDSRSGSTVFGKRIGYRNTSRFVASAVQIRESYHERIVIRRGYRNGIGCVGLCPYPIRWNLRLRKNAIYRCGHILKPKGLPIRKFDRPGQAAPGERIQGVRTAWAEPDGILTCVGGAGRDSPLRGKTAQLRTGFSLAWATPDGIRLCVEKSPTQLAIPAEKPTQVQKPSVPGRKNHATRDSVWVRRESCGTAEGAGRPNSGETMRVIERIVEACRKLVQGVAVADYELAA